MLWTSSALCPDDMPRNQHLLYNGGLSRHTWRQYWRVGNQLELYSHDGGGCAIALSSTPLTTTFRFRKYLPRLAHIVWCPSSLSTLSGMTLADVYPVPGLVSPLSAGCVSCRCDPLLVSGVPATVFSTGRRDLPPAGGVPAALRDEQTCTPAWTGVPAFGRSPDVLRAVRHFSSGKAAVPRPRASRVLVLAHPSLRMHA